MGFLDLFFTTNKTTPQEPLKQKASQTPIHFPIIGNGGVNWLNDNSQEYITNGYAGNPTITAIIKGITDLASGVPFYLYEIKNGKKLKRYKSLGLNNNLISVDGMITKEQSLQEVENHKINDLLEYPNADQTWSEFLKAAIGYKLLTGNSYIYGLSPEEGINKGKVIGMTVLPAQLMNIVSLNPQEVDYYNISGSNQRIAKEQIMHMKYWNPDYNSGLQLYGQSPLKSALKSMTLSNTMMDSMTELIGNKGAYGLLSDEAGALDEEKLTQLKNRLLSATNGEILITSATKLNWLQLGLPIEDLQMIEAYGLTLRTLCNVYGYPSLLLGDDSQKTYSNLEQAEKSLIYKVIVPELTALRDSLNRWILPAYEKADNKKYFIDFDISVLPQLSTDMKEMVESLKDAWWISGNQRRNLMKFDSDTNNPLMDDYLVPSTLVPLSDLSVNLNNDPSQDLSDYN
jgi:HK97 family phage portal protein